MATLFESYERRISQINAVLGKYGIDGLEAHPTNPVEGCADANPKTMLPNDT